MEEISPGALFLGSCRIYSVNHFVGLCKGLMRFPERNQGIVAALASIPNVQPGEVLL